MPAYGDGHATLDAWVNGDGRTPDAPTSFRHAPPGLVRQGLAGAQRVIMACGAADRGFAQDQAGEQDGQQAGRQRLEPRPARVVTLSRPGGQLSRR